MNLSGVATGSAPVLGWRRNWGRLPSRLPTAGACFLFFCLSCFFVFFTCNSHTLPKKKSIGISHIVLQQQYNMWLTLLMLNSLSFKFLRAFVTLYLKCRSLEQPLKEMLFIGSRFVIRNLLWCCSSYPHNSSLCWRKISFLLTI